MDRQPGLPLLIFAQPGANSLAVDHEVLDAMKTLAKDFPPGLDYKIIYDPTIFVGKSVNEVVKTIFIAILLVVGVVFLFLQSWRAAIIPVIAIPVSLVGTFTFLYALGVSLNNLSLFGLVLAVGIVVDDAIVVVENVERNLERGMSPKEAAHVTMNEVGGALISIALTLVCGVRALRFPVRHHRSILPAIRDHDCRLDPDLLLRLADPEPCPLRGAVQGP